MNNQLQHYPGLPPLRLASRARQEYAGACPFCGGNHRSDRFRVWMNEKRYWCRQCNESGWLDTLTGERGQKSLPRVEPSKAQRHVAPTPNEEHITFYRELYGAVALWAHANLLDECNPEPHAYLHKRGLSDATIGAALLGYTLRDPDSLPNYLRKAHPELIAYGEAAGVLTQRNGKLQTHPNLCGTLVLPYMAGKEIVDLRTRSFPGKGYRSLPGSYIQRGADRPFGWDETERSDTIILTEGELKALAVTQAYRSGYLGVPAIAQPGLSYLHPEWPALLKKRGVETVILAYDSQPRPSKEGVTHLSPEEVWSIRHGLTLCAAGLRVRVLRLPLAAKADKADLDAFILAHGTSDLDERITTAPSFQEYHASLPHSLLHAAKLPPARNYPIHRARPRPIAVESRPTPKATTSLSMAREAIPQIVAEHTSSGKGILCLAHPPGTGKGHGTTAGLQAWRAATPDAGHIGWTGLRKDQHQDQDGLNLIALHGRNEENCHRFREVETLHKKGYPVREALCNQRCPHLGRCDYLHQFRTDADHFAPQPMLLTTTWWQRNAVMVLDEFDFTQLARIVNLDMETLSAMHLATTDPHAHHILRWLSRSMVEHGGSRLRGIPLLHALEAHARAEGMDMATTLSAAEAALPSKKEHAQLRGLPKQASLADFEALPPGHLPSLVRQLAHELRKMRSGVPFTSRIEVRRGTIALFLRHEHLIRQLARSAQPKVLLDATLPTRLLKAILPNTPIQIVRPHIPIPGIVRQIIGNDWAKSTLSKERKTAWHHAIAEQIRPDRDTLIVCTKDQEDNLQRTLHAWGYTNCTVKHYGNLRGSNAYKGYDVILAQIYHPNLEAIIEEGRALFADDPSVLDEQMIVEERILHANDGSAWAVQVANFADSRLAALLEHHREAEMEQCALRGRPFDHPESQITLMFSMPLPNLPPTQILIPESGPDSNSGRKAASLHKLIEVAQTLIAAGQTRISVDDLANAAKMSEVTVRVHWNDLAQAINMTRSYETIRPPGRRSYKRAILIMPEADSSAAESGESRDQAHNKDSITSLISAQTEVIPAVPDPLPLPDGELAPDCASELIAAPEQSEGFAPNPQRSYPGMPRMQRDRGASITHLLHPQRGQPLPDTTDSANRRGRDAMESAAGGGILRIFDNKPRPP
ncbi:hypothetical protein OSCT_0046 [Oscillochloris trichoides DG-6]|uniref:Uncharacterized protein n=1 Tax=Oscillochloris trichoides DG-6 TaxID=765420 RepID=E1I9P5_9CHLR|nr:hypothetical protein [Oscillochloris trichoides]EFO82123.1 hypothetical protein OSCT_0046 [Oscillochloris trichoides DG-6]